jgi:hypothetical protein
VHSTAHHDNDVDIVRRVRPDIDDTTGVVGRVIDNDRAIVRCVWPDISQSVVASG